MGRTVLLIESDKILREIISIILKAEGIDVVSAKSLEKFGTETEGSIDLILLDVVDQSHFEKIKKLLKKKARLASIPIVLMSTSYKLIDYSAIAEVKTVLAKPFEIEDLLTLAGKA